MMNELILKFPSLRDGGGDFDESISYEVDAVQLSYKGELLITHTLNGQSFISDLIRNKKAKFAVSLFYKDHAERQNHIFDEIYYIQTNKITAKKRIKVNFGYAPKISAYIFILENHTIVANDKSGLSDFWQGEEFMISAYSKLAYYPELSFSNADISLLVQANINDKYKSGEMKIEVLEHDKEKNSPITIECSKDVYDILTDRKSSGILNFAKYAIMTQCMCFVYFYMSRLTDEPNDELHEGLLKHMDYLEEKTGQSWRSENFNASLAATRICPYLINKLIKNET